MMVDIAIAGIILVDKVVDIMLNEDIEKVTEFLGYKPDDEVFNNRELLEEDLINVARDMDMDDLAKICEEYKQKQKDNAEKIYCLSEVEKLLKSMENCKKEINHKKGMSSIVEEINLAITNIESLLSNIK